MQQAIGQGRLAMIDMRNNAEISYVFDVHRVQNSDTSGALRSSGKSPRNAVPRTYSRPALRKGKTDRGRARCPCRAAPLPFCCTCARRSQTAADADWGIEERIGNPNAAMPS